MSAKEVASFQSLGLDLGPLLPQATEIVLHIDGIGELVHVMACVPDEGPGGHALLNPMDVAVQIMDVGVHGVLRQAWPFAMVTRSNNG